MRVLATVLLTAACLCSQTPESRKTLNEGIAAFKNARYTDAVASFEKAVQLSPADATAHLYLGTALMSQYIPGAQTPENARFAVRAESEFRRVLDLDARNVVAMESLASLAYTQSQGEQDTTNRMAALDRAADWYKRLIDVAPDKKEAHYSLGVIGWSKFYPALMAARQRLGMKPEDPGPLRSASEIAALKSQYDFTIEDAMEHLKRALELDPQYDDAMAYMNLLVRERADLAPSVEEYRSGVEVADEWVQKALESKRSKAESASRLTPAPPPPPPAPRKAEPTPPPQ